MSDVTAACGEACAGCNDECAACKAEMCADCGGCDHQRKLNLRARAATASLVLGQPGAYHLEFGFNPRQLRGPDGRWIKMGGAGSAGGKRRVAASRADAPSAPDAPAPRQAIPAPRRSEENPSTPPPPAVPARRMVIPASVPADRRPGLEALADKNDEANEAQIREGMAEVDKRLAEAREFAAAEPSKRADEAVAELEHYAAAPRGDAAVESVKAARDLVALAETEGYITRIGHGSASDGAPFFTIEAINPETGNGFEATWHTFGAKGGKYRLFNAKLKGRKYGYGGKEATVKSINEAIQRDRPVTVDTEALAEEVRAADPMIPAPRTSKENNAAARVKTTRNDNGTTTYEIAGKSRNWTTVEAEDLADALDAVADGGSVPPPIPGRVVSDGYNRRTVEEVQPFRNNKGGVTLTVGRDKPSGEPGDMDMTADEARELAKLLRETAGQERTDSAARKAARANSPEQQAAAAEADRRERRREAARVRRQAAKDEQLRQAMGVDQDSESQADNPPAAPLSKKQRDMGERFDRLAGEHASDPSVARWRDKAIQLTGDMENSRGIREQESIRDQMYQVQDEFGHAMAGAKAAADVRAAGGDERDAAIARRRAGLGSRADRVQKLIEQAEDELKGMPKYKDALVDPYADLRRQTKARIVGLKAEQKGYRDKIDAAEKDHDTKLVYDEKGDLVGTRHEPPPGRPDTGPDPAAFGQFRPTPDEEWSLQERRLKKRTPQLDPDADFKPGDVVPTSDGKWQEILPGDVRERFGEQYVNVMDDSKGYRHTETVTNIRSRVRRYAAEKAWRDAGGSKDRLDGKDVAPPPPAQRAAGEPEVGEDGKYTKPVKLYVKMPDGTVHTRGTRNPYKWVAEYTYTDSSGQQRGWVSWHRSRALAERGNLTGDQRSGGVRVKAVHPVTFNNPEEG